MWGRVSTASFISGGETKKGRDYFEGEKDEPSHCGRCASGSARLPGTLFPIERKKDRCSNRAEGGDFLKAIILNLKRGKRFSILRRAARAKKGFL